jgi:tRNA threonylcarbamoyladenosine biosynthesis protein TsaE|tara:strand:- start:5434 stop:5898 length:465 start_codon:yes stop_codon:yes gene_type:complete
MIIESENRMMAVGEDLGRHVKSEILENYVIFLEGDLGAGKTTFVKGFMKGMEFQEVVNSPTFSLIELIELDTHYVFHVDLYRINRKNELYELDLHEETDLDKPSVHLIEWPEKGKGVIIPPDLKIAFKTLDNPNQRDIFFEDFSHKLGNNLLTI